MATLENREVVQRYVGDLCNGGRNGRRYRGGTLFVSSDDELIYNRRGGDRSHAWGPVTLCHWNQKNRLFVLNGDGFADRFATGWQTNLRGVVQTAVRTDEGAAPPAWGTTFSAQGARYILVPFRALDAAGIDRDTIRVVEMQQDGFELVWHPVEPFTRPVVPPKPKELPTGWSIVENQPHRRTYRIELAGNRWQLIAHNSSRFRHRETGETKQYLAYSDRKEYWQPIESWGWLNNAASVWAVSESGPSVWTTLTRHSFLRANTLNEWVRDHPDPGREATGWVERVHHLGAALFTAKGTDGKRHLYLSAFDEQERNQPMYYLARLPDEAKKTVSNYGEAILALAPPLVHQAWAKGIPVHRQGDVFAIQTNLTDEQVYQNARSRVRRDIVLAEQDARLLARVVQGTHALPEPGAGEVRERVPCELCHHHRWIGYGPKAKRSLSIYRTGHTATEVVVGEDGTTYVRGTMHHDPFIEEPGRRREHQEVPLGEKWHVAVRNTVPRRKVR